MALFVTRHQHTDETCPAGHPEMGPMLLQHLSDENVAKAGINIRADAVVEGHTFYMIVEAPSIELLQQFMTPFTQVGQVEILEASSCSQVVERGSCGASGEVWVGGKAL